MWKWFQTFGMIRLKLVHPCSDRIIGNVLRSYMYLTGLETSWRLVGDSSLRWLRRHLRDVAATSPGDKPGLRGVAEKSNMFDFFLDFFQSPAGHGDVSATSPLVAETNFTPRLRRRPRDVTATSPRPAGDWGDVSATSPSPAGDWGDVAATSPRHCLTLFDPL